MRAVSIVAVGLSSLISLACSQAPSSAEDGSGSETQTETEGSETDSEPEGWRPVLQANAQLGALMSVWGPSPAELFVVGGQPEPGGGVILRGADERWAAEALPAETSMLNWVYGVDGEVWSVGIGGAIVRREGAAWVAEPSGTDRVLWGLWGASADELWAVGGDGVGDAPVLLRRDAELGEWAPVELPELGVDAHALFKIWGLAAADVWAVGDAGAAVHWDGASWTAVPDPDGVDLISVWGSDAEGLIAVGGRASARVDRLIDGAWVGETLALPGLNGVWVDPEAGATAVGVQGTIYRIGAGGFELSEEVSGTAMVLHAVFGFAGGPRYAVGGSLLMPAPFVGVIVKTDT